MLVFYDHSGPTSIYCGTVHTSKVNKDLLIISYDLALRVNALKKSKESSVKRINLESELQEE